MHAEANMKPDLDSVYGDRQSVAAETVGKQDVLIEQLEVTVYELTDRLEGVLAPDTPEKSADGLATVGRLASPYVNRLSAHNDRIDLTTERLRRVMTRLEF